MFDDGQTEAGPPHAAAPGAFHAVEALENTGQMLRRNPGAKIADQDFGLVAFAQRLYVDFVVRFAVLHGIVQQIGDGLLQ